MERCEACGKDKSYLYCHDCDKKIYQKGKAAGNDDLKKKLMDGETAHKVWIALNMDETPKVKSEVEICEYDIKMVIETAIKVVTEEKKAEKEAI